MKLSAFLVILVLASLGGIAAGVWADEQIGLSRWYSTLPFLGKVGFSFGSIVFTLGLVGSLSLLGTRMLPKAIPVEEPKEPPPVPVPSSQNLSQTALTCRELLRNCDRILEIAWACLNREPNEHDWGAYERPILLICLDSAKKAATLPGAHPANSKEMVEAAERTLRAYDSGDPRQILEAKMYAYVSVAHSTKTTIGAMNRVLEEIGEVPSVEELEIER